MKRQLRVVVLLDDSADLAKILNQAGSWWAWVDAHVVSALKDLGYIVTLVRFAQPLDATLAKIRSAQPDVVFNLADSALDDRGKDAYAAVMLELAGIPFTGAGPRGLFLAGDKAISKTILRANGIDVPYFQVAKDPKLLKPPGRVPLLVKALNRGGSEGLRRSSLVSDSLALKRAAAYIIERYGCPVICEEFIVGRELSVGIVGERNPRVLPASEWKFGKGPQFVTERLKADLKYSDRCGTKFTAATLTPVLTRKIASVCRNAYTLLELRDYGSIDLRVTADGRIVVLDVNANPGLVSTSRRWKPIPFTMLVNRIVRAAMGRDSKAIATLRT